jgi:hypothetical protein
MRSTRRRARSLLLGAALFLGGPSARAQNLQVAPAQKPASPAPALVPLNQGTSPQAMTGVTGVNGVTGASGATGATGATGTTVVVKPLPAPPVQKFGRFDLDQPLSLLAQLPDLKACASLFATPTGHAECALGANDEKLAKVNLAWAGGELIALRLTFDPLLALPLTDLEWQLTRGWGAPALEQMRREHDNKMFTLQWEDAEHRATLEAAGVGSAPSRAVAISLERKPHPLPGELATLKPKPFPNMRARAVQRLQYDGQSYAVLWGTSLTPAQEALGESGPAWSTQRSYVGLFKLDPMPGPGPGAKKRWHPVWERASGDEEDNDMQRIVRVDTKDVTGDLDPDLTIELSCQTCGASTSEVMIKTVRAGKPVDLLDKRDLYRASVDSRPGQIRIREAEGDDTFTVSTYAYDKSKGAFVLAREERVGERPIEERQ